MIADLRSALRAFLLADAAVSAAVGGGRIFSTIMPQGVKSASLVFNVISETTDHVTTGPSGLVMVRLQLDAYAELPDDADSLARLVKERIDGYRGPMVDATTSPATSIDVQGVFADTMRTGYEPECKLYRCSRDYLIWYGER